MTELQVAGIQRKGVQLPDSWNDLSKEQLLFVYGSVFVSEGYALSTSAVTTMRLIFIAQRLAGLTAADLDSMERQYMKQDADYGHLLFLEALRTVVHAAIDPLFTIEYDEASGRTTYAPKLTLTKNHWPMITGAPTKKRRQALYAPADGLENITIYELALLFTEYEQYIETQDDTHAHRLLAMLYRPSKPATPANKAAAYFGDIRLPLRQYEATVEKRVELMASLPGIAKRVLLFWFASCRQQIVEMYPKVFSTRGNGNAPGYGWGGLLLELAGGVADLDKVADNSFHNVFTYVSMKHDEMESRL